MMWLKAQQNPMATLQYLLSVHYYLFVLQQILEGYSLDHFSLCWISIQQKVYMLEFYVETTEITAEYKGKVLLWQALVLVYLYNTLIF